MQPRDRILIMESDAEFAQDMAAFLHDGFGVDMVDSPPGAPISSHARHPPEHTAFVVAVDLFPMFVEMLKCQAGGPSGLLARRPDIEDLVGVLGRTVVLGSDATFIRATLRKHFPTCHSSFALALPVCTDRYPAPSALHQIIGHLRHPDPTSDALHRGQSQAVQSKQPVPRSSAECSTDTHQPGVDWIS